MATGKRIVLKQIGNPAEVLETESFEIPKPSEGEVLVRMLASPINPADLNTVEGTYGIKLDLPAIPGIEGCGAVEISESPDFKPGDIVLFLRRAGTWATHTLMPAASLFKLPKDIDPIQAAMLKVNPATAWLLLNEFADLRPGDWIVQNAANSGVGRCVIQLAASLGVHTISLLRRPELIKELQDLGGDHVFLDDKAGIAAAKEVLSGANASLAFNAVGGDSALGLMKLLREGGSHITYGAMGRKPLTVPNGLLIFHDIQIRGLWVSRWLDHADDADAHRLYFDLSGRLMAGTVRQAVDSTFPLDRFADALERLQAPDRRGKVLFIP